jgi:hypothetical protein
VRASALARAIRAASSSCNTRAPHSGQRMIFAPARASCSLGENSSLLSGANIWRTISRSAGVLLPEAIASQICGESWAICWSDAANSAREAVIPATRTVLACAGERARRAPPNSRTRARRLA